MTRLFVSLLAVAALAGCRGAADAPPTDAAGERTLVLAIGGEPDDGFDPLLGWGAYGHPLFQSALLKRTTDLDLEPDLAASTALSDDRRTWAITLRDSLRFSDGTPLTARDVAFTYNTAKTAGGLVDLSGLDTAVVTGPRSVELRLAAPLITFVHTMSTLGIVPAASYGPGYGRAPVGSGPYRLVEWDEGQQLIVEANPYYYGAAPHIRRVVFLFSDETARFAAAQAGTVDIAAVPPTLAVQPVAGMTLRPVVSVDERGIMLPTIPDTGQRTAAGKPIGNDVTADVALRRALNVAVDRQALVDGILEGHGARAFGPIARLDWAPAPTGFRDADPARARAILAQGGWRDTDGDGVVEKGGHPARFTVHYVSTDVTRQALAVAFADQVKAIGVQVDVLGQDWEPIRQRQHADAVLYGTGSFTPTELYRLYHSTTVEGGEASLNNPGYYANADVDRNLDAALAAPTFEASVPFWRAAQGAGTAGPTAAGDAPWVWLVLLDHTYLVGDDLDIGRSQTEPHGHGYPITANLPEWRWKTGAAAGAGA